MTHPLDTPMPDESTGFVANLDGVPLAPDTASGAIPAEDETAEQGTATPEPADPTDSAETDPLGQDPGDNVGASI